MFNIWKSIIYFVKLLISQILGSLFLEIKHLPSILFNLSQAFGPNIYRSLLAMMVMAERLEFPHPDDHTIWTTNMPGFKPQHTCWTCMLPPIFSTGWKKIRILLRAMQVIWQNIHTETHVHLSLFLHLPTSINIDEMTQLSSHLLGYKMYDNALCWSLTDH